MSKHAEVPEISSSNETDTSVSEESTESSSTPEARNDSRMKKLLRSQLQHGEMVLSKYQDTGKEKMTRTMRASRKQKKDKQGRQNT